MHRSQSEFIIFFLQKLGTGIRAQARTQINIVMNSDDTIEAARGEF